MSLFRYPHSKNWHYEFWFEGQRVRESARTKSKKLAREAEMRRRRHLEESYNGIQKREKPKLLAIAAKEWLQVKKLTLAASSYRIENDNLKHILPVLGKKLVSDLQAHDIGKYQQARSAKGASAKTINLEVGTLRAILKRHKVWPHIQQDVRFLPVQDDSGHALTADEEEAILQACIQSRSRSLHPAVVLALSTGMRYSELRPLRWQQVDLLAATIVVGKSKTEHGSGRTIPLNRRALETIKMWSDQFRNREKEHFVFPSEKYGASGDAFVACAYGTNPREPIHSWKVAWQAAKKRAAENLSRETDPEKLKEIKPLPVRFHDLRHTACTRMLEGGVPYPVVASIMGWSAATAIRMAKRYGHIGQKAYKDAVELLNGSVKASSAKQEHGGPNLQSGTRVN